MFYFALDRKYSDHLIYYVLTLYSSKYLYNWVCTDAECVEFKGELRNEKPLNCLVEKNEFSTATFN